MADQRISVADRLSEAKISLDNAMASEIILGYLSEYGYDRIRLEQGRALYERAAFSAFKEVADALVTIQKLREQRVFRERQVNALIRAVDTSRTRFQGGTANYLDVLNAVEALLPAQLNFAQIQGDQLGALVQLYRALGGGWNALDGKAK